MAIERITIKELRARCQNSAEAPSWASQSLAGKFTRFFSIYLTWVAIKLPFTPNQITVLGTLVYCLGAVMFIFPDFTRQLIGVILIVFSYVIDGVDGELARYRKLVTSGGAGGVYAEPVSHDVMYGFVLLPLGYGLSATTGSLLPLTLAAVATVAKLLYRMLEMRWITLLRYWAEREGRTFGVKLGDVAPQPPKTLRFFVFRNIFTGTGMVLPLLVSVLLRRTDIFLWFYTFSFAGLFLLLLGKQVRQIIRHRPVPQGETVSGAPPGGAMTN